MAPPHSRFNDMGRFQGNDKSRIVVVIIIIIIIIMKNLEIDFIALSRYEGEERKIWPQSDILIRLLYFSAPAERKGKNSRQPRTRPGLRALRERQKPIAFGNPPGHFWRGAGEMASLHVY